MNLAERSRQVDGDAQVPSQVERLLLVPVKNPIQGFAAGVLEYEDCPSFVTCECQRLRRPYGIELGCKRIFVLDALETLRRRMFSGR